MTHKLFNKLVLYTTPFQEMDEAYDGFELSNMRALSELRQDPENTAVNNFRVKTKNESRKYSYAEWKARRRDAICCEMCGMLFKSIAEKHGDHDHDTGEWRGVLCCTCNLALGALKDSPELCLKAAAYLLKHKKGEA